MDAMLGAALVQEGGHIISEVLKMRRTSKVEELTLKTVDEGEESAGQCRSCAKEEIEIEDVKTVDVEEQIEDGTACIPCTNSHLHACAGLLDEGVRMSPDGLTSESMVRVDKCLREIAAAERVDLAPENIATLPPEEKEIAKRAAKGMREIRHGLDGLNTKEELVALAIKTNDLQKYVGAAWFQRRMSQIQERIENFSPEDKAEVARRVERRLEG